MNMKGREGCIFFPSKDIPKKNVLGHFCVISSNVIYFYSTIRGKLQILSRFNTSVVT